LERLRSELFNAGVEWESALANQAIASFAVQVIESYESLPARLRAVERPEQAILGMAADARRASVETGTTSAALPLAERALVAALIRAVSGDVSLTQLSSNEAATRFEQQRGEPGQLLGAFVGELLGQYARHVTAREMGAMSEGRKLSAGEVPGLSISDSKRLARALADEANSVGRRIGQPPTTAEAVQGRWAALIGDAFARGRALPENPR
jgi:hypothetical protein